MTFEFPSFHFYSPKGVHYSLSLFTVGFSSYWFMFEVLVIERQYEERTGTSRCLFGINFTSIPATLWIRAGFWLFGSFRFSQPLLTKTELTQHTEYKIGPFELRIDNHAYFYFKVWHWAIAIKNARIHPLLFSERNGYFTGFRIGRFLVKFITYR